MLTGTLRARLLARSADALALSHARHLMFAIGDTRVFDDDPNPKRDGQSGLRGTVRGRLLARSPDGGRLASSSVERSLAVMNSGFGEPCSGPGEVLREV
jgi:hypothetical protein